MRYQTTLAILQEAVDGKDPEAICEARKTPRRLVDAALKGAGYPDLEAVAESRRRLQREYEQVQAGPKTPEPLNEAGIQLAMSGERTWLRPVERREAALRLTVQGIAEEEICRRLRVAAKSLRRWVREAA